MKNGILVTIMNQVSAITFLQVLVPITHFTAIYRYRNVMHLVPIIHTHHLMIHFQSQHNDSILKLNIQAILITLQREMYKIHMFTT